MIRSTLILIVLGIIFYGSQMYFSGEFNPRAIRVEDTTIKLPYGMRLSSISGSAEVDSLAYGLAFAEDPYSVEYPAHRMTSIAMTGKEEYASIILIPSLSRQNLYQFSKTNSSRKVKDCLVSDNQIESYIIKGSSGYVAMSSSRKIVEALIVQICSD